jgi:hypothetical protein
MMMMMMFGEKHETSIQNLYIVTCSTEGRRCYATLLSLLRNRGRTVPWIRWPLSIVALHGNQEYVGECWLASNRGWMFPWIRSPLGIVVLHGNQQ